MRSFFVTGPLTVIEWVLTIALCFFVAYGGGLIYIEGGLRWGLPLVWAAGSVLLVTAAAVLLAVYGAEKSRPRRVAGWLTWSSLAFVLTYAAAAFDINGTLSWGVPTRFGSAGAFGALVFFCVRRLSPRPTLPANRPNA